MEGHKTEAYDFPIELFVKPQALVGISGLDTKNNAIHKSIWEIFTSNKRTECAPVVYKLIDNAYEFPVVKPKRNSYEWYLPKGILKKNWMDKHLQKIPSIIVIFYDLDWNDTQWSEKMIECASRVQSMRVALEGRNTKISVVLIQNKLPILSGDDVLATERAAALCASSELNTKSLFILPHGDHMQGYAVRLETAFYDLAQNYYHTEARHVKSHREHLNKNTHQYLFVRHQFKMGFLNELKQDNHTAHKHYTHAYNNLLEIRIVDTNAMEIRTIAGFINYKLCRLMFALNLPRDAISQFKAHTERFKTRLGFQELTFEHYAWMSKQFSVFGDIFDEAVKQGLPAVQTQHPGLYYQQAVQYAILRKKASYEICGSIDTYPSPDPLAGSDIMEFYGQRPWRPGKVTADPPDPQIESNGIKAIQCLEKQVNHSNNIISLYGLAVSQFKTYRCPRTRRYLVVEMAEEYYNSGDYGKALTLFTHMLWDYRSECWWTLLSHVLDRALCCAYLTARVDDYVLLSLELLGKQTTISAEKKKHIYSNLNRILKMQFPEPPELPEVANVTPLWQKVLVNGIIVHLEMNKIVSCIDCKARFIKDKYQADEKIRVEIYVKNSSDFPINFSSIRVNINHTGNPVEYSVDEKNFLFLSDDVKMFVIEFLPCASDIDKEVQLAAINLHFGYESSKAVVLKFSGMGNDRNAIPPELIHFRNNAKASIDFDSMYPRLSTQVVPRNSKLNMIFEHAEPALLYEWYPINFFVLNEKNYPISNLEFEISLVDDDANDTTEFSRTSEGETEKLPITFNTNVLPPNEKKTNTFYMRAHNIGERMIHVRAFSHLEEQIPSVTEEVIRVSVVKPFDVTTRFLSKLFEDVNTVYVDEDFVVMPIINCLSPWPIVIDGTKLDYNGNLQNVDDKIESQLVGNELRNGETAAEIYLACTNRRSEIPITVGQYTIEWHRLKGKMTTSQMVITGPTVDWIPLDLKVNVPAHGLVRTPMLVEYHLTNKSTFLVQIDVSIEGSEAFMFAGYKQYQVNILPGALKKLKYNLYPLIAGSVSLPKLVLSIPETTLETPALRQEQLNALLQRSLPTHIFVMPQVKGSAKIPMVIKSSNLLSF